ncbi:MAG: ABC transporter substrate-binding protein [Deltaproteobacteria bacterium]|nr:ABC transporter substrate-binding protein [Deltaproteobacteria bacterium]
MKDRVASSQYLFAPSSPTTDSRLQTTGYWLLTIYCLLLATGYWLLTTVTVWAGPPDVLKVGVIGPETGEEAELGLMTLDGVELAVQDINSKGGINGRKVEVIHYDTRGSGVTAQNAIAKLIREKIIAIIASPSGWSTFAPVWMVNESRTIFISAGSRRHIGRSGPYIFRVSLPDEVATQDTIKYCVEKLGFKRFAIITSMMDDEYSLSLGGLYRRAVMNKGGQIVAEAHLFLDETINEAISRMKKEAKGPIDAIIFTGDDGSALTVLKEARKQGLKAPLIGGEELYREEFLKGGEMVDGSILYSSFASEDTSPQAIKFIQSYKKKRGKNPTGLVALGYDSFMLVAKAAQIAGSFEPPKVRDALARIKAFQGITGKIDIGPDGETIIHPLILRVEKKGMGYGFSLVNPAP